MLTEAQIELVDEAGHVEDRVRIVGAGEIALATKGEPRLQVTTSDPSDVDAIIALRGGMVTIEVKKHRMLRVNDEFLSMANPLAVRQQLVALIMTGRRELHVRAVVIPDSSLMSTEGAVIREQPSELLRQTAAAAAKGALRVKEHLARLRAQGAIDEQGRILVAIPEDMNPESKTDL